MFEKILSLKSNLLFINPEYLSLFVLVYVLIFVWIASFFLRYKNRPEKTAGSRHPFVGRMLRFCFILILFVIPLSILSLARPYFPEGSVKFKNGSVEVLFVVDDSISMWAKDVSPSRLGVVVKEISKVYSSGFIEEGDRAALFLFGKTSLKKLRLSRDIGRFINEVSKISQPETLIGDDHPFDSDIPLMLEDVYGFLDRQDNIKRDPNWRPFPNKNRIVLFFGDGDYRFKELSPEDKKRLNNAIGQFRRRGLKIFSVGIGTRVGSPLVSVLNNYKEGKDYDPKVREELKDQGLTRLDISTLNFLSNQTGGSITTVENESMSAEGFLKKVINDHRKPSIETIAEPEKQELWQEFLFSALFFLVVAILIY